MAARARVFFSCLYWLNPALHTDAGESQGIWTHYAYYVGTASNKCSYVDLYAPGVSMLACSVSVLESSNLDVDVYL
jgi:hypothetical protein